ncbi:hypothetical protein PF022_08195 [Helicobacter sp. WB40]|nr:hypothetical protein [Helicobacter sp. WB40]MDA3967937.1 hypothetical protein [Helicobacter sp. WB40]
MCKFLDTQNNTYTIYNHRPEICRIDVMYEKVYKQHFDVLEFYTLKYRGLQSFKAQIEHNKLIKKGAICHYH